MEISFLFQNPSLSPLSQALLPAAACHLVHTQPRGSRQGRRSILRSFPGAKSAFQGPFQPKLLNAESRPGTASPSYTCSCTGRQRCPPISLVSLAVPTQVITSQISHFGTVWVLWSESKSTEAAAAPSHSSDAAVGVGWMKSREASKCWSQWTSNKNKYTYINICIYIYYIYTGVVP